MCIAVGHFSQPSLSLSFSSSNHALKFSTISADSDFLRFQFPSNSLSLSLSGIRRRMASGSAVEEASKEKVTAPYGSWKSPITAEAVSSAGKRSGGIAVDGTGRLCWLEPRPHENG